MLIIGCDSLEQSRVHGNEGGLRGATEANKVDCRRLPRLPSELGVGRITELYLVGWSGAGIELGRGCGLRTRHG